MTSALGTPSEYAVQSGHDGSSVPLLSVDDLAIDFAAAGGVVHAVRGISFDVGVGETIGIVGESGSGKSATALAVLGLLPGNGSVARGQVLLEGRNLLTLSERELRDVRGGRVAMVYQDPLSALNPVLTIGRQLTEVLERHLGLRKRAARDRAVELLGMVGIPHPAARLADYPHQFSGGMRQRVMIAMAISCSPRLIVADEPTTALDVTVQAQILELLQRLKQELRMSLVLITHDLGIVAGTTDRVLIMYAGRIVEDGPTELVLDDARMPYTLGLLRSVPRLDRPRQATLTPIPGAPPDARHVPAGCPFQPRCSYRLDICAATPTLDAVGKGHRMACWVDVTTGRPRAAVGSLADSTASDPSDTVGASVSSGSSR